MAHGGKREGSGRKPVIDKKVTLTIYPQQSRIDTIGIDRVKAIALAAIEKEFSDTFKNLEKNLKKYLD